jgi:SSS family solute:Na+ symporter
MTVGMLVSLFWLLLVKAKEASAIGLVQLVTGGKTSLLADYPNWPSVDPIIIALPLAILTLILVSAITKASDPQHLRRCFPQYAAPQATTRKSEPTGDTHARYR